MSLFHYTRQLWGDLKLSYTKCPCTLLRLDCLYWLPLWKKRKLLLSEKEDTIQVRADRGWDAELRSRDIKGGKVQVNAIGTCPRHQPFKASSFNRMLIKRREKRTLPRVLAWPPLSGCAREAGLWRTLQSQKWKLERNYFAGSQKDENILREGKSTVKPS